MILKSRIGNIVSTLFVVRMWTSAPGIWVCVSFCDDNGRLQYGRFRCPVLLKTNEKVVLPSSRLQQRIHIVHDCLSGKCVFESTSHSVVEEREEVQHNSLINKHDFSNNRYLFNRFFLGCSTVDLSNSWAIGQFDHHSSMRCIQNVHFSIDKKKNTSTQNKGILYSRVL